MPTSEQQPDIDVDGSGNTIAGRDINYSIYKQEGHFNELSLEQYESPRFPEPESVKTLVGALKSNQFLMIGGQPGMERADLARHIAWHFSTKLHQDARSTNTPPCEVAVLEWDKSSESRYLPIQMRQRSGLAIFLLSDVRPQDIILQNGIDSLYKDMNAEHYIIASTSASREDWGLSADKHWYKTISATEFNEIELARTLIWRLDEARVRGLLPNVPMSSNLDINSTLWGRYTPRTIAQRLKTFDNILAFIHELKARDAMPVDDDAALEALFVRAEESTATTREMLQSRYRLLDEHSQLLCLNLGFFNGLLEDQFFATLEELVQHVWRVRDPQIRAFDYADLTKLELFFQLAPTRSGQRIIQARIQDQRRLLLEEAWRGQRRQIIAARRELTRLVQESVANNAAARNHELYGDKPRRDKLREVIGETLSEIGLIDVAAVEPALATLATHSNLGVQLVAAVAMARWRYYDEDKRLFDTLERWQNDTRLLGLLEELFKGTPEQQQTDAKVYIRSSIALAVGRASRYDPPDQLEARLLKLFEQLSQDPNYLVRRSFLSYTLPQVLLSHLRQIHKHGLLEELLKKNVCIPFVAASLALAYRIRPGNVVAILDQWYENAKHMPIQAKDHEPTQREHLIATVARTYGEIDYSEPTTASGEELTATKAFKWLSIILNDQQHPFIRQAVFIAVRNQAEHWSDEIGRTLQDFTGRVYEEAVKQTIVDLLVDIYRSQRSKLQDAAGGWADYFVELKEPKRKPRSYPAWSDSSEQPDTPVEKAMYDWIIDRSLEKRVARQVAIRVLIKITRTFDIPIQQVVWKAQREEQDREEARAKEAQSHQPPIVGGYVPTPKPPRIGWLLEIVLWTATVKMQGDRALMRELLPELLDKTGDDREAIDFMLKKWARLQGPTLQTQEHTRKRIGLPLKQVIARAAYRWLVLVVLLLLIILLSIGILII